MKDISEYVKTANCHTGEVDGYGYAFVPGNANGVMLLDSRTRQLLENLSIFQKDKDEQRIILLEKRRLIRLKDCAIQRPSFNRKIIKSIGVWLHVTNNCNLGCNYCYVVHKEDRRSMTIETAKSFLDKLEYTVRQHDLKFIEMRFAGGEPTMNKEIVVFVADQMRKRFTNDKIRIELKLITNGTLLGPEWIELLKTYSISFCISLDGVREWNDKTRPYTNGAGSFDQIHKNLEMCLKEGLRPGILTTITENNIQGIPLLNRFLIDLNLPFRYAVYRDNAGSYGGYKSFIENLLCVLNDCYAYYANAIRERNVSFNHQLADIHLDKKPHLKSCNVGYSGVTVNHLGKVFLCQAGMDRAPIGDLSDKESLLQMAWNQKTLPELYEKVVTDYDKCRDCQWALACGGGCPLVNSATNGSPNTASPYCELSKEMIPKLIELRALKLIQSISASQQKRG